MLGARLHPLRIVETGVGRGLTTRVLLEALEHNGSGHLWSIDLPPLLEDDLAVQTAAAVPQRLYRRGRWLHGSSRRRLPDLIAALGQIDLFVHDSMHTARNVRFELEQVWPHLAATGALPFDDVDKNTATGQFLEAHPQAPSVISTCDDGTVLIGFLAKTSGAGV